MNIRFIRRRIKSAQNIAQITQAMEMVAASKMKRAQEKALMGKPYCQKIYQVVAELAAKTDPTLHPLLTSPLGKGVLVVLISTNKGLCGGLNTELFWASLNWFPSQIPTDFITLGKKGALFVARIGRNLIADFSEKVPFSENVGAIASLATEEFLKGKYKEVNLVYNDFISVLRWQPEKKTILPLKLPPLEEREFFAEFLMEPSYDFIFEALLPHYLEVQIRASILSAEAAEHVARMLAMRNATDNALELVRDLTLEYNKTRQQGITAEIADIVTAKRAVEG
ncbi:MAG: F-type H+-transporting ATPase subunit gamma [Microgenomates group bacterium LiPW_16]|nr:MAG: F-type H+-transporting ATPase subunit gamma [Microgenomates group bacterium LiPW_16]